MDVLKLRWLVGACVLIALLCVAALLYFEFIPTPIPKFSESHTLLRESAALVQNAAQEARLALAPAIRYQWADIESEDKQLPDQALIVLQPVHPKNYAQAFRIGIQPEKYPTAWLGVYECEAFGTTRQSGMEPIFPPHSPAYGGTSSQLKWLSTNPPLLWISGHSVPDGSGWYFDQFDYLVLFDGSEPKVLFKENFLAHGRGGWDTNWGMNRKLTWNKELGQLVVEDESTRTWLNEPSATPLFRRPQKEFLENAELDRGNFAGEVHQRFARTYDFKENALHLIEQTLAYQIQPGDTWTDIAEYFYQDPGKAEYVKKHQASAMPNPIPNTWVELPPGWHQNPEE